MQQRTVLCAPKTQGLSVRVPRCAGIFSQESWSSARTGAILCGDGELGPGVWCGRDISVSFQDLGMGFEGTVPHDGEGWQGMLQTQPAVRAET